MPLNSTEAMEALELFTLCPKILVESKEAQQSEVELLSHVGYVQEKCQPRVKNKGVDTWMTLRKIRRSLLYIGR